MVRRRAAHTALALVGAAATLAACGGHSAGPTVPASPTGASTRTSAAALTNPLDPSAEPGAGDAALSAPPLPAAASYVPTSLPAVPSSFPPAPAYTARSFAPPAGTDKVQIDAVYDRFLQDMTGLYATDDHRWSKDMALVATPELIVAADRAADAIKASGDRAVGTIQDRHRAIDVEGNRAALVDCLDEFHWYVINTTYNAPDPSVTRDFFAGFAAFTFTNGTWLVSVWKPGSGRCHY